MTTYDVAIIGGGVIGAACARESSRRGLHVAMLEPGPDVAAASPASAGMLAAQIEPMSPIAQRLAVVARGRYDELGKALHEETGVEIAHWKGGIAALALDQDVATRIARLAESQRGAGLRAELLDQQEVQRRWKGVAREVVCALFAPDDGAVDPQALTRAFTGAARRHGTHVIKEAVQAISWDGGDGATVVTESRRIAAAQVVLAAGAWSPNIGGLPRRLAVEPVRGQMASTLWPARTAPGIFYHDHRYVIARGAEAVMGSTMEQTRFDNRVTNEGLAQIFQSAVQILPALARQPVIRMWAGLRPVTPDGQPLVGRDPERPALIYATGHGRNGVLFAALTGEIVGDLAASGSTKVDVSPWRPERDFSRG